MNPCWSCGRPCSGRFCGKCGADQYGDQSSVQGLYEVGSPQWRAETEDTLTGCPQQPYPQPPYQEQPYPQQPYAQQYGYPVEPEQQYPGHQQGYPPPGPTGYQGTGPPPQKSGTGRAVLIGLAVVAVLAAVGFGAYWQWLRNGADPAAQDSGSGVVGGALPSGPADGPGTPTDGTTSPTGSGSSTTQPPSGDEQALQRLRAQRTSSLSGLELDGRWVLQLSSKYPGVEDPHQIAPVSGGHVFGLPDIWADFQAREQAAADRGMPVLLLVSSDFGKSSSPRPGQTYVVLADPGGIGSRDQARGRCAELYPGRSGAALDNQCLPRRLNPPG